MPKLANKNCCWHGLSASCLLAYLMGSDFSFAANPADYGKYVYDKPDSKGFVLIPPNGDNWTRHFRFGAMVGTRIGASFKQRGLSKISGNNPANGIYDDGYVRQDQTGNEGGYTSYWGYNNASQYSAAAQTLSMHSASSYSTAGGRDVDGDAFAGFDLAYGDAYWYWKRVRVGWEFGFGLLPINISDNSSMPTTINQSVYTFNTGGIVVPGAPYQGGFSGQGPLLPGTPASVTGQALSAGTITGTRSLDLMLYTMRLGPNFFLGLSENTGFSLGVGPAIGVVSGEYTFNEKITYGNASARNKGGFGSTEIVFGGYVNATLMYHVVDNGRDAFFYISAEYAPMENATFSNGHRSGQLNLDGQLYLSAGLGWPF